MTPASDTLSTSAARRERERRETRHRILEAARELFVEEGVERVTMRAIADRIAYTPTAIYHHFRDKDALLQELCRHDFRAHGAMFARVGRIDDPVERLRKLGAAYVQFGLENPSTYRFLFMMPHPVGVDDPGAGNPDEDSYAMLRATVRECIEAGRFASEYTDPERVAQMCWAACHGIVSLHLNFAEHDWITWREPRKSGQLLCEALVAGMVVK
ncbi:MAG: TetR/AcrR family transcriptional regulator [Gemmatimonadales bacterium]|jgi:AcrR family transcriptional regulator|nr:TetR/AcrR family transcriptional regulator [Gemmatimonadales bacterium]